MIAQVIPAKRLPRGMGAFDYDIPETLSREIKIGSIVKINFSHQNSTGIVLALKEKSDHQKQLKEIEKVEFNLDEIYVDFLHWLSEYYLSPLPLVVKTALPEFPKRASRGFFSASAKGTDASSGAEGGSAFGGDVPADKIKKIDALKLETSLITYDDWRVKIAAILKLAALAGKKQVLILSPGVPGIFNLYRALHEKLPKVAVLYDKMPKGQFADEWKKILSGETKIIIGTRQAIFAPALNLGAIILDDEESPDFKQYDQNPRYDARTAAEYLCHERGAALIVFSELARPTPHIKYKGKTINLTEPTRPATIVDLKGELKINRSLLGRKISELAAEALQNGQKVILFLNRRGIGGALYCRDCGYIPRCGECGLPLKTHENSLLCHHCAKATPMTLTCDKCGGANLTALGFGTKKIEQELRNNFPEVKIGRLDKDNAELSTDFDILIATEILFKKLVPALGNEKIGLVGVLQFEPGKNRGAESTYEALNLLIKLKNLAARFDAEYVIQTPDPENKIFEYLMSPNAFYAEESEYRRLFKYPPFVNLIRLFYQNEDAGLAEKTGAKTLQDLRIKLAPTEVFTVKNIKSKIRGRYRFNIIIKVAPADLPEIKAKLKILVPTDWHIDVDPVNLND